MIPNFAILLAAYNGTEWLEEQITSIIGQKNVTVQIFISVDLSTDNTESLVDKLAADNQKITVLTHGGIFGGAVANFFRLITEVEFNHFDYVAFADQDDIWVPTKLERSHQQLLAQGADGYSSDFTAFWPSGEKVIYKKSYPQREWDFLFESAGPGCTYVMTPDLACALQSYLRSNQTATRDVWLHDWLCYAFARANGYKWHIDDFSSIMYRQHVGNQVGVNYGWKALLYRAQKVISGWALMQSILIASLMKLEHKPFVERWVGGQRLGLLMLAFKANVCRRRFRDQIFFACSCLIMAIKGIPRRKL